jgi:hypothetical protein
MPRQANTTPGKKIEPKIPLTAHARLNYLVKIGFHGNTPTEVARTLLLRALEELWREGKLPDELPSGD